MFSEIFHRMFTFQRHFPKDCHFPSGLLLEIPNGLQWHFPMEFHFCEFWCVFVCPESSDLRRSSGPRGGGSRSFHPGILKYCSGGRPEAAKALQTLGWLCRPFWPFRPLCHFTASASRLLFSVSCFPFCRFSHRIVSKTMFSVSRATLSSFPLRQQDEQDLSCSLNHCISTAIHQQITVRSSTRLGA